MAAAVTPARLTLALAAVHAVRPRAIRELHLDDIDIDIATGGWSSTAGPARSMTWLGTCSWPGSTTGATRGRAPPTRTDPLHLAAVFGLDDTTAIRYAAIARQLLETPAGQHDAAASREPGDQDHPPEPDDTPGFIPKTLQSPELWAKPRLLAEPGVPITEHRALPGVSAGCCPRQARDLEDAADRARPARAAAAPGHWNRRFRCGVTNLVMRPGRPEVSAPRSVPG